jgi:poly(A) polymerase
MADFLQDESGVRVQPRILERREHPVSRRDIDPRVLKVLYRLTDAGHIAYLVGGSVRDLMIGRRPKDFDIATSAHPQEVRDLFRNSRLIGRRFRLVHVFFGQHNIEVATFRRRAEDVPDPDDPLIRHDNTFGTPEEDAFRRDFTINALFYNARTFHVIDYAGGVEDLRAGLIRTIGDPELRMREDPVRMLRAVRFAAKLGFEIEPATRAAITRHREDLRNSSVPRVVEEIYRAIGIAAAARAFELMREFALFDLLLPVLAKWLRAGHAFALEAPTGRNVAEMGRRIDAGVEPVHSLVLACLFADLWLNGLSRSERIDLTNELRRRGFARGDVERMRLVLDALPYLDSPSRRTRRLAQRPYFNEARTVFEIVAAGSGFDVQALTNFLQNPDAWLESQTGERRHGDAPHGEGGRRGRRRRRGRRGGRAGRRRRSRLSAQIRPTPEKGGYSAGEADSPERPSPPQVHQNGPGAAQDADFEQDERPRD